MRPIATDVVLVRSVVCVSVCALVIRTCPAKRLNRSSAVWGLTRVGARNHVSDGGRDYPWKWAIWGLSGPLKSIGSRSKMIIRSSIKARNTMRPFVEILRPIVRLFCHTKGAIDRLRLSPNVRLRLQHLTVTVADYRCQPLSVCILRTLSSLM